MARQSKQFNDCDNHVCFGMFCKHCSKRFNEFVEPFININTCALVNLDTITNQTSNMDCNESDTIFNTSILQLISIKNRFESLFRVYMSNNQQTKALQTFFNNARYPITDSHFSNPTFKAFLEEKEYSDLEFLTMPGLLEFQEYCLNKQATRPDIMQRKLFVSALEIEQLEEKYNIRCNTIFPRIGTFNNKKQKKDTLKEYNDRLHKYLYTHEYEHFSRTNFWENEKYTELDALLCAHKSYYSFIKAPILCYLDILYCSDCSINYNYIERLSENLYINGCITSTIFNSCRKKLCLEMLQRQHLSFTNNGLKYKLRNELIRISSRKNPPFSKDWENVEHYYDRLCILPLVLEEVGVREDHYTYRKNIYFDDYIKGHPLASHGWFKEALDEFDSLA